MANTFSVQTSEVRRRVTELTHAITEVTQARIRLAAENPLDGGLEECVGQAVAFGAMFHAAALQLPPAESVRDYIQALVSETLRDMVGENDKPLIYGANNEIANAPTPAVTPEEILERLEKVLPAPDTSDWTCLICGCADDRPCPGGCRWVAEKVCSACAPQNQIKLGTLKDFPGERVRLMTGVDVVVDEIADHVAVVQEPYPQSASLKLWAGTGCILFTEESIYGDG